jgi:hypothetical protein
MRSMAGLADVPTALQLRLGGPEVQGRQVRRLDRVAEPEALDAERADRGR